MRLMMVTTKKAINRIFRRNYKQLKKGYLGLLSQVKHIVLSSILNIHSVFFPKVLLEKNNFYICRLVK